MYSRLLVPLDGSSNSIEALKTAIRLAKDWHASLVLLHIDDITQVSSGGLGASYNEVVSAMREASHQILTDAQAMAADSDIPTTILQSDGSPKQHIVEIANSPADAIDLIVIGKSGTNAFSRMVVGSTTNYVVQHARPNVFVVNDSESTKS